MEVYTSGYRQIDMKDQDKRKIPDIRGPGQKSDPEVRPDELGSDPSQVGHHGAGQSGGAEGLSSEADAAEESVEGLADTGQALESAAVEGVEDASEHPERPAHTHMEYGNPEGVPPAKKRDKAA